MFDEATVRAVERIAARTKTDTAAWLAVAGVESAGRVFASVNGRNEPLIRFEGITSTSAWSVRSGRGRGGKGWRIPVPAG